MLENRKEGDRYLKQPVIRSLCCEFHMNMNANVEEQSIGMVCPCVRLCQIEINLTGNNSHKSTFPNVF
jgi:hypothetical protein